MRIAEVLELLGRDDEAEVSFQLALDSEERDGALMRYGWHLLRRERAGEAVPVMEEWVEGHPDDLDAQIFLADAYSASGRRGDALRTYERALIRCRALGNVPLIQLLDQRLAPFRGTDLR